MSKTLSASTESGAKLHIKIAAFMIAVLAALTITLSGCASDNSTSNSTSSSSPSTSAESSVDWSKLADTNILGLNGPTGIGIAKLMDEASEKENSPLHFSLVNAPDQATAAILSGEADIAFLPTNLASTLYNRTKGGVEMIAITSLGNLYILEEGDTVNSLADLRGQTIYATGQGANPQYVLEHLLTQAGLTPGQDVTIEYLSEHAELATLVASGERKLARLPEPFVATAMGKNADLRIAINLNEAWENSNDGELTLGCAVVRTDFLEKNLDTVNAFLELLKESINYTQSDVSGTAALCVKYGIMANEELAEKAIPNC